MNGAYSDRDYDYYFLPSIPHFACPPTCPHLPAGDALPSRSLHAKRFPRPPDWADPLRVSWLCIAFQLSPSQHFPNHDEFIVG